MKRLKLNPNRVFRCGNCYKLAYYLRAAFLGYNSPSSQGSFTGARLVRSKR